MTDTDGPRDKTPRSEASRSEASRSEELAPQAAAAEPQPDPLLDAQREAVELKDKLLRTLAEMENLRRRTEREVADARTYGVTNFARDIVGVADSMERALKALDDELRDKA